MAQKLLLTVISTILLLQVYGLSSVNTELYTKAELISPRGHDISSLHSALTADLKSHTNHIEIFAYWIHHHVAYDVVGYETGQYILNKRDVLRDQRGVCEDYSRFFKELCDLSGIECHIVHGYAKGFGYDPTDAGVDHAWNAVNIQGQYYLMDCTWSSGYVEYSGGKMVYKKQLELSRILADHNSFASSHLPNIPMWQLRYDPISYSSFVQNKTQPEKKGSFKYHFLDTIASYVRLDSFERKLYSARRSFSFNPTATNAKLSGSAITRLAYQLITHKKANHTYFKRGKQLFFEASQLYKTFVQKAPDQIELYEQRMKMVQDNLEFCNYHLVE